MKYYMSETQHTSHSFKKFTKSYLLRIKNLVNSKLTVIKPVELKKAK